MWDSPVIPGTKIPRLLLPSAEFIREHLEYDPIEGTLTRIKCEKKWMQGKIDRLGTSVGLNKKYYKTARLIWKLVTGEEPPVAIDHEDGNSVNFVWTNLRESDYTRNAQNRAFRRDLSTTGHKGVRLNNSRPNSPKRFVADITVNRKRVKLGAFYTLEEAVAARLAAEHKYFGENRTDRVLDAPWVRP